MLEITRGGVFSRALYSKNLRRWLFSPNSTISKMTAPFLICSSTLASHPVEQASLAVIKMIRRIDVDHFPDPDLVARCFAAVQIVFVPRSSAVKNDSVLSFRIRRQFRAKFLVFAALFAERHQALPLRMAVDQEGERHHRRNPC